MILSTPSAVKVAGLDSWIHHTQLKSWESEIAAECEQPSERACEPIEDLMFLVKKKAKPSDEEVQQITIGRWNLTTVPDFILMGLMDSAETQLVLSMLFLLIYLITVLGNLGMIILTQVDPRLQTPMYFFLKHLALTDLGYSTAVGPKMLVNFVADQNTISYYGCAIQMAFFTMFIISELFILAAMSYDRYVAICNPLLYTVIMSPRVCWILVGIPYLYSTFVSLLISVKIFTLSFCEHYVINHFYCDCNPLNSLLCSSIHEVEYIIMTFAAFNSISSLLMVLVSYLLILITILRMKSAEGRRKAFSTCGSHLTMVTMFYGTLVFMYVQPKSSHSSDTDKVASIFYTLVIPLLNPLIYSLRNKDVKYALHRTWKKICKCFSVKA
ncbi:olfactory receptor 8K3-like [Heterocephalus glaber]|uniref:Olfactory receptor n=1 Tax=Heterocephalus glaber TaxID=10181 RepID=A0AAX6QCB0_HETGA|nr:olfactory receptor 8K3-like [Heterocephalus glaber]